MHSALSILHENLFTRSFTLADRFLSSVFSLLLTSTTRKCMFQTKQKTQWLSYVDQTGFDKVQISWTNFVVYCIGFFIFNTNTKDQLNVFPIKRFLLCNLLIDGCFIFHRNITSFLLKKNVIAPVILINVGWTFIQQ